MALPETARETLEKAKRLTYVHYYTSLDEPTPCGLEPGEGRRGGYKSRIDDTTCPECLSSEGYQTALDRRKYKEKHRAKARKPEAPHEPLFPEYAAEDMDLEPVVEAETSIITTEAPTQDAAVRNHVGRCTRAATAFNTLRGGDLTWRDVSLLMELVDAARGA